MEKKGVSQISGTIKPVAGEKYTYHVTGWYPDTEAEKRNPKLVTWELFKQRKNGNFTSTNIRKKGISEFTFGEKAVGSVYKLEAYLYAPEGGGLIIHPQPSKIPIINKVELLYIDDTKGTTFSFMEKLRTKAYCTNMLMKELTFTLWEDDIQGKGHNPKNKLILTKKAKVDKNGVAAAEFMLTRALMHKAMQGEADSKQLEFYVTVEYYAKKKHTTENIHINNPFPPINGEIRESPAEAIPKAKNSPAEQKPPSMKEEKGIGEIAVDKAKELWDWLEAKGSILKEQIPTVQKPEGKSPVVVKETDISKPTSECFCKENQFSWSNKLNCSERKKVLEVCAELWGEDNKKQKASELMSVMHLETNKTFNPAADNGAGYSGLIQFSDESAKSVGTTRTALKEMTFVQQMDFVKKYFYGKKDVLHTMTDLYLLVLKQNAVGHGNDKDYILFDESVNVPNVPFNKNNLSKEPWVTKYGYSSNPSFMRENGEYENRRSFNSYSKGVIQRRGFPNGKTYVWEVTDVLTKNHYDLGNNQNFNGTCENIPQQTKPSLKGKRAPWMEIVLDEAKNYGGYDEGDNPLSSRIKNEYFSIPNEYTTKDTDPSSVSWCAAFASWCLKKAGYSNPSTCRALEFNPDYLHDGANKPDRASGMRKISKPVYGCIVVWKNVKGGGGHVAFHYGYETNGNIIPLGGNQGSSLKFSSRSPNGDYDQKIVGYFLPENYADHSEDEFTDEEKKLNPKTLNKSSLLKKSNEEISGKTT